VCHLLYHSLWVFLRSLQSSSSSSRFTILIRWSFGRSTSLISAHCCFDLKFESSTCVTSSEPLALRRQLQSRDGLVCRLALPCRLRRTVSKSGTANAVPDVPATSLLTDILWEAAAGNGFWTCCFMTKTMGLTTDKWWYYLIGDSISYRSYLMSRHDYLLLC
jgi:hypothetical protein